MAPTCMAQPPSVGPVMMPYMGDRIVAVAESDGGANSSVNRITRASAKLASLFTELFIDDVQHALVLSQQRDVVLDVLQEAGVPSDANRVVKEQVDLFGQHEDVPLDVALDGV